MSPLFHGQNIFISPLAINTVLAFLQNGAQGQTLTALTQGLQLGNASKGKTGHRFHTILSPLEQNRQMFFANGLFLDNGYTILPAFETVGNQFFATVTNLNFSASQNSANRMNNWIASQTHGQIQQIISAKSVHGNEMIVFSSFYFRAQFQNTFNPREARVQKFFNGNCAHAQAQEIDMMYTQANALYGNISALRSRVVMIPFDQSEINFLVVLPWDCGGLSQVEQLANTFNWTSLNSLLARTSVSVTLPKFNIAFNSTLKGPLTSVSRTERTNKTVVDFKYYFDAFRWEWEIFFQRMPTLAELLRRPRAVARCE